MARRFWESTSIRSASRSALKTGYCDVMVTSLDEALRILKNAVRKGEATSVGLVGNCADVIPELAKRGVVPDLLTDQTSAHDPIGGYVPNGMTLDAALELRKNDPEEYKQRSMARDGGARPGHAGFAEAGRGDVRLRKQYSNVCVPAGREKRVRLSGICAGVHPTAVLRRQRSVPLGGAFRRGFGHCADGPSWCSKCFRRTST